MRVINKINEDDIKSLEERFFTYKNGKKEGKHVGWRAAVDESYYVLKWFENQSNKADAIRYLIEENILLNGGVVNLAEELPRFRNFEERLNRKLNKSKKQPVRIKKSVGSTQNFYDNDGLYEEEEMDAGHQMDNTIEEVKPAEILETPIAVSQDKRDAATFKEAIPKDLNGEVSEKETSPVKEKEKEKEKEENDLSAETTKIEKKKESRLDKFKGYGKY